MQQLTALYEEMLPILEHNLQIYNNLQHENIMKVFKQ